MGLIHEDYPPPDWVKGHAILQARKMQLVEFVKLVSRFVFHHINEQSSHMRIQDAVWRSLVEDRGKILCGMVKLLTKAVRKRTLFGDFSSRRTLETTYLHASYLMDRSHYY